MKADEPCGMPVNSIAGGPKLTSPWNTAPQYVEGKSGNAVHLGRYKTAPSDDERKILQFLPDPTITDFMLEAWVNLPEISEVHGTEYGIAGHAQGTNKGFRLFAWVHNKPGNQSMVLQFDEGEDAASLGLTGEERLDISGIEDDLAPGKRLSVKASKPDGGAIEFTAICRIDTPLELAYFRHGGILSYTLRELRGE